MISNLLLLSFALVSAAKIHPEVSAALARGNRHGHAEIFIKMTKNLAPSAIVPQGKSFASRTARTAYVAAALEKFCKDEQSSLITYLKSQSALNKQFWVDNTVFVRNATFELVEALEKRQDVAAIEPNRVIPWHRPIVTRAAKANATLGAGELTWGIKKIRADQVWSQGNRGAGVVVASIDTGVMYDHEALIDSYRGNTDGGSFDHDYNWFDPDGFDNVPADGNGHGTHTAGTIAGGNGIGVAPDAKWMACKGCSFFGCSQFALTSCAEFMTCPTKRDGSAPDCTKSPDVINNSWGGGQGDEWYDSYIAAWLAAGIVPVFSEGNSGPDCGTANSPGDSALVIGVGATDEDDYLAAFSSRGPAVSSVSHLDKHQPDVSAPGVDVYSSVPTSTSAYAEYSGTSMAAPHVTGVVALMIAAQKSEIAVSAVASTLESTAVTKGLGKTEPATCGGTSYSEFPNFFYGFGRIDAVDSVGK